MLERRRSTEGKGVETSARDNASYVPFAKGCIIKMQ
jgi:hypothetical protein